MNEQVIHDIPESFKILSAKCTEIGFDQPSDLLIGSFLKTLVSSKPAGKILEMGTGIGLSLSWMMEGLGQNAEIISFDNDQKLIDIVKSTLTEDSRLKIECIDGFEWLEKHNSEKFDLIFADTWPGKYYELDITLDMVSVGGYYIIDDMNPAGDWPEGHAEKANQLIEYLENRSDFHITKMNWSTGVIVCTKTK